MSNSEKALLVLDEVTLRHTRNSSAQFVELFNYSRGVLGWELVEQWEDARAAPGVFHNLWRVGDGNRFVASLAKLRAEPQYVELAQLCVRSQTRQLAEPLPLALAPPSLQPTDEYLVLRQELRFKFWSEESLEALGDYARACAGAGGELIASAAQLTGRGEVVNLWAIRRPELARELPAAGGALGRFVEDSRETLQPHVAPSRWASLGR